MDQLTRWYSELAADDSDLDSEVVEEEIMIPALPPFEEAIQKLHELDEKLLWQNNQVKEYYSELTET